VCAWLVVWVVGGDMPLQKHRGFGFFEFASVLAVFFTPLCSQFVDCCYLGWDQVDAGPVSPQRLRALATHTASRVHVMFSLRSTALVAATRRPPQHNLSGCPAPPSLAPGHGL
jgi:hypothetical protein